MRLRPLLALLGILVLASAAWLAFVPSGTRSTVARPQGHADPGFSAPLVELEPSAAEALPAPPEREEVATNARLVEAARTAQPEEEAGVLVMGSIVVVDELGVEHEHESGSFWLFCWGDFGGRNRGREVEVRSGAFEFRVPATSTLSVMDVQLGGGLALFQRGRKQLPVPEDRRLALRVVRPRTTQIIVRAADTGLGLSGIQGLEVEDEPGNLPTADVDLLELGDSPMTIVGAKSDWPPLRTFLLRAPGYAWQTVGIDPAAGGERVVELVPGGALVAHVRGDLPAEKTELCIRPPDSWCEAQIDITSSPSTLRFESLPAGPKHVGLLSNYEELASAEVEVVAGTTVSVELDLMAGRERQLVPLEGTLHLPAAWGLGPEALRIVHTGPGAWYVVEPRATFQQVTGKPDFWSWKAPAVEPGQYDLGFDDAAFSHSVDVPPGRRMDVHVEVPPPAEVEVVVLERGGRAEARAVQVAWNAEPHEGMDVMQNAEWSEEAGAWTFRAPVGEIQLQLGGDEYEFAKQRVEVLPGNNHFTFEVARACGVLLRLADRDTVLPWPDGLDPDVRGIGHGGLPQSMSYQDDHVRLSVSDPGRYGIVLGAIPGYLPVENEEVEIPPGSFVEHVVHLVRKP